MSEAKHSSLAVQGRAVDRSNAPPPAALRPFHFPPIHRRTLDNGVRLMVVELRALPVVTLSLVLEAGAAQEAERTAGLAALTTALLDEGAGGRSAADIAERLERLGVDFDAAATWDAAHAGVTGLRSRIEPAAELLADFVRRPDFPEREVDRLRHERLAEIAQRRAQPGALAAEMTARFLYAPESPFARPLGGTEESVAQLTTQDVRGFHAARFLAPAATLVVTGDLSVDESVELAERHFGDWGGGAIDVSAAHVAPHSREARVVIVDRPGSVQSEVRVAQVGTARDTPDYFPLIVMNTILGGAFTSRLNLNLRERHGYTYGVSSGFAMRRQPGPFLVSTAVQTEVTADAVREIFAELRAIRDEPVRREELQDARSYLAGVFPLRLQTTEGVAARLVDLAVYDLPDDYLDRYRARVAEVTADEVARVARAYLRPDEMLVLVVGDAAAVRGPLEALEIGPISVVDAHGEAR